MSEVDEVLAAGVPETLAVLAVQGGDVVAKRFNIRESVG